MLSLKNRISDYLVVIYMHAIPDPARVRWEDCEFEVSMGLKENKSKFYDRVPSWELMTYRYRDMTQSHLSPLSKIQQIPVWAQLMTTTFKDALSGFRSRSADAV